MRALGLIISLTLLGVQTLFALDPLPVVEVQPGYRTWTLESSHPRYKLERLMADLRSRDAWTHEAALKGAGFEKERVHTDLRWPRFEEPMQVVTKFMSFERRKLALLTVPAEGRTRWYMIALRQEGQGEDYWRPVQAFVFDTDVADGLGLDFADINGEQTFFPIVRHLATTSVQGRGQVDSLLRYDEKRFRLTFQEFAKLTRPGSLQGEALRMSHKLEFPGDQHIVRTIKMETFPFMRDEEFEGYEGVRPETAKPSKVKTVTERFAWNPLGYNFYDPAQELEKLVRASSPVVRRDAAKRLGEALKTTHPQIETAMRRDKDPYVRMQAALAIAAIGDPKALPSVEKALLNYDEPDTVREALEKARLALSPPAEAGEGGETVAPKPRPKKKKAAVEKLPELAPEGPKITVIE